MKLDESTINHLAMMEIQEITECFFEDLGKDDDNYRIASLASVKAISEFSKKLKEALRA